MAKRQLNIDPESLVPQLPRASDLRPFPTTKCIRYIVPGQKEEEAVLVRCLSSVLMVNSWLVWMRTASFGYERSRLGAC